MLILKNAICSRLPTSRLDRFTLFVLNAIFVALVAGYFSRILPQLELLVHFQIQYACVLIVIFAICLVRRKRLLCLLALLMLAIPLARIVPWYVGNNQISQPAALRILSSNVNATNEHWDAIQEMVLTTDADIVVLIEATTLLQDKLQAVESLYPYSFSHSLDTGAGFLLFSRVPLVDTKAHVNGVSKIVTISSKVQAPSFEFDLVAVHPIRPGLRHGCTLNEGELTQIANIVQGCQNSVVVIGDLNTTMWSNGYATLVKDNELHNLRKGRGVVPTWGANVFRPILSIPIDHCLVRGDVHGVSFDTVSLEGTDHVGIIVGLVFD